MKKVIVTLSVLFTVLVPLSMYADMAPFGASPKCSRNTKQVSCYNSFKTHQNECTAYENNKDYYYLDSNLSYGREEGCSGPCGSTQIYCVDPKVYNKYFIYKLVRNIAGIAGVSVLVVYMLLIHKKKKA